MIVRVLNQSFVNHSYLWTLKGSVYRTVTFEMNVQYLPKSNIFGVQLVLSNYD